MTNLFSTAALKGSSSITGIRIHGPANPGENAPVLITFPQQIGLAGYPFTLTEQQAQWLKEDKLYLQTTSDKFPNGEVRGQLAAAPVGVCIKVKLRVRDTGSYGRDNIIVRALGSNNQELAKQEGIQSQADGTLRASFAPTVSAQLLEVRAKGFLPRRVSVPRDECLSLTDVQALVPGDFNGNDTVDLADIVTGIRARNSGMDAGAQVAIQAFGGTPTLQDLVDLIRTRNTMGSYVP